MLSSADYATACNEIELLIKGLPTPKYTDAEVQKFRDGSDPINYPNTNMMDEALKKFSAITKHNLSVSGGNERIRFFTSVGYQFEDNDYKYSASNYKQYNVRSNIDIQATESLKFFANLSLRQEDRNSPYESGFGAGELWRNIVQGDPTKNITWPNGSLVAVTSGGYNPIASVNGTTGYIYDKTTYINADLGFNWDFSSVIKGLGLDGGLYVDKGNNFRKTWQKAYILYNYNSTTDVYTAQQFGPKNANLSENMNQNLGITANIRLKYNRTINGVHNIAAFVAYEQYESKYDYLSGSRTAFVSS